MQAELTLKLLPSEAGNSLAINQFIAAHFGVNQTAVTGFYKLRQSLDARGRQAYINVTIRAFVNEPFLRRPLQQVLYNSVHQSTRSVLIIGAGPAGLFAALRLIELGIRPVILERGKDVRSRRRDLAMLNKQGIVNPESNYCFGEGGAGTYSDGKLYTRSSKRGDINRILNLFVQFGAQENILYEAHPHIGTNKLPQIITSMRQAITDYGGIFLFEKKVVGLQIDRNVLTGVKTADGESYKADATVLATGHSARDIFEMLHQHNILIEAKGFALGVRVEHPQHLIDNLQYGGKHGAVVQNEMEHLPPASYSLVQPVEDKGVFSFCMCPGGIIAPAATTPGQLVVNGWSPSKRNNPYANSGMVVTCEPSDLGGLQQYKTFLKSKGYPSQSPLSLLYFQQMVEEAAYNSGGGAVVAPAQRVADFVAGKVSSTLPACSYIPGLNSVNLGDCLPPFVYKRLQKAFKAFDKKMKGYLTNEGVILATESRTSSPVRIPRDKETLQHPQVANLYPCGEGAGYAGGIVSAAMDGERIASTIAMTLLGK